MAVVLTCWAGCSGDDTAAPTTTEATTTTVAAETLTVRLVAREVGLGCTSTTPIGTGSRLTVESADGEVLGLGTFDLSVGADVCDWTTTVDDVAPSDFYTLVGDGADLLVVSADEVEAADWSLTLLADVGGVSLVDP